MTTKQDPDVIKLKLTVLAQERRALWDVIGRAHRPMALMRHWRMRRKHSLASIAARDGEATPNRSGTSKLAKRAARWSVRVDGFLSTCRDLAKTQQAIQQRALSRR